jgi:hypothetical protein
MVRYARKLLKEKEEMKFKLYISFRSPWPISSNHGCMMFTAIRPTVTYTMLICTSLNNSKTASHDASEMHFEDVVF